MVCEEDKMPNYLVSLRRCAFAPASQANPFLRLLVAGAALFGVAPTVFAGFTVVNLHPVGATSSVANGIRNGQKVGKVDGNTAIWNSANVLNTSLGPGTLLATDGVEQVGVQTGAAGGPAAWYGTANSKIDLSPNPPLPNQFDAEPLAVFAGIQAGYILTIPGGLQTHAIVWSDSGTGYVDLTPNDPTALAIARGEYIGQETGSYTVSNNPFHAAVWYGSAASLVDLNPSGASSSEAFAVYNGRQVGFATFAGMKHAGTWNSTALSFVDLQPFGADESIALAVNNGTAANAEVGFATFSGVEHAAYWAGTAGSFDDLQSYLPAGYSSSRATGIWINPSGQAFITGYAVNALGNSEAMLWVQSVPEPGSVVLLAPLVALTWRRKPRR
jgi:hypothetical protein